VLRYVDGGSANGSFVRGEPVGEVELDVGDRIAVGPYEIEVCAEPAGRDGDTTTGLQRQALATPTARHAAMAGLLREVPLSEVFQGIEFNKKTGALVVRSGDLRGTLEVREGAPWSASLGRLRDEEAVVAMASLKEGRFTFVGKVEDGERSMRATLTGLLLEASRREDEGGAAPVAEPEPDFARLLLEAGSEGGAAAEAGTDPGEETSRLSIEDTAETERAAVAEEPTPVVGVPDAPARARPAPPAPSAGRDGGEGAEDVGFAEDAGFVDEAPAPAAEAEDDELLFRDTADEANAAPPEPEPEPEPPPAEEDAADEEVPDAKDFSDSGEWERWWKS